MSHLSPSPAPGTPQTATKAYAVTAAGIVILVASAWVLDTGGTTAKELTSWVIQAVITSGLLGGLTWLVPNQAKR
jgi:hypothetical protein